jgi:hypothetical protein
MNHNTFSLILLLMVCGIITVDTFGQSQVQSNFVKNTDTVLVYSTAKDTDLKLSLVSKPTFKLANHWKQRCPFL